MAGMAGEAGTGPPFCAFIILTEMTPNNFAQNTAPRTKSLNQNPDVRPDEIS